MSDVMKKSGFPYAFNPSACETCEGRCCTGESGYIYVNKQEIKNISTLLKMEEKEFVAKYLFKKMYKYSLKERKVLKEGTSIDSYECIFYDAASNGCTIYEVRPLQCRTFPFWDYYKTRVEELKLECPGITDE
ncbi:YkgJ family cysteine cluster protein [Sulfurimonas sp. SAG-AH-194-I05]|nr:YkgJ family cysteine cluster protein [Sulfurimonas sp. SAG-AH-194-I05]MDF1875692.1 YkgJ family cysteine cluster protein [Sulfurimonas sp. SAG-AH-194-I05]